MEYGQYNNNLWKLPKHEIAPPNPYKQPSYNWVRNIVTVLEVGLDLVISFIPGVDFLDPWVIGLEIGANEAGGVANFWVNKQMGGNNWMTDFFNFVVPVVAPIAIEIKNVKNIKALINDLTVEETEHLNSLIGLSYNKTRKYNTKIKLNKLLGIEEDIKVNKIDNKPNYKSFKNILLQLGLDEEHVERIIKMMLKSKKTSRKSMNAILDSLYTGILRSSHTGLNEESKQVLIEMINIAINSNEMEDNMSAIIGSFKAWNKKYRIIKVSRESKFGIQPYMSKTQKLRKILTSKKFKHDYVDRLKYINPSMAARKPINFAYKKLESYFSKWFNKMLSKDANKVVNDYAKKASQLTKREFAKLLEKGETIGLNSRWLATIKVVKNSPELNLCLITFDEQATWGKQPVFIWATVNDIKELLESPGRTYLDKFAISRGGKHSGLFGLFGIKGASKIENELFGKLVNFLPVQALRNVLSIAGNFKREIPKMENGTYFKTYFGDFKKSFENYGIGRVTRLASRGILAPLLTHSGIFDKVVGKIFKTKDLQKIRRETRRFLGMEIQRYSTAVFAYGVKNVLKGQSFTHGLKKRLEYAISRTPRDQMLHYQREITHGQLYRGLAIQNVRYRRVGKIYRRLPNLMLPNKYKLKNWF